MDEPVTLERIEMLVGHLPPREQLQLLARISERLSTALSLMPKAENAPEPQIHDERLRLTRALCAEVEDIADDAQGECDAAHDIRHMRDERIAQICRSGA